VPGFQKTLRYQIRRAGGSFRLVGPHDGVTNYEHGLVRVRGAHSIVVKMRSLGDPYVRCSCPPVAGKTERRYELSRHIRTTYSGEVVVAVSSFVATGSWRWRLHRVQARLLSKAGGPGARRPTRPSATPR
jgi:hypothetical protein